MDEVPDSLDPSLVERAAKLRAVVRSFGSVAVAFSGGVDSTLVLKICRDELGEKAVAVTARSESYPEEEFEEACRIAREIGARQVVVQTSELEIPGYAENPPERCFACKSELYRKLSEVAARENLACLADGVNRDDAEGCDRPGVRAAELFSVRQPLRELGFGKPEIRRLARALGLRSWQKPAMACLSSRIPFGERITAEKLDQISRAESALRRLGFYGARVRHHGSIARLELPLDRMNEAVEPRVRSEIVAAVKASGFVFVTLDLEGYVSGSMHRLLQIRPAGQQRKGAS